LKEHKGSLLTRNPNQKRITMFLGIINYDRQFVNKITELLNPFYQVHKKENKFKWGEKEKEEFEKIKNKWTENFELAIPDMKQKFY
jgi:hypothetical protein